ncbi:MAG: hypothetical protein U0361_17175 [Nitrospiraceae bacterium]
MTGGSWRDGGLWISFWKGRTLSLQGDPEYRSSNFPEVGPSKTFWLTNRASLEFGTQTRRIRAFFTEDGHTYLNRDTFKWVNQEYLVFNWNWDTNHADLAGDVWASLSQPFVEAQSPAGERRFSALFDLADACLQHCVLRTAPGRTACRHESDLRRTVSCPSPALYADSRLDARCRCLRRAAGRGHQHFHTAQPILAAEYTFLPGATMVAGTIHRNHPFVDALFNDAMLFSRPVEQGFQMLVDREHYQQDLFIN